MRLLSVFFLFTVSSMFAQKMEMPQGVKANEGVVLSEARVANKNSNEDVAVDFDGSSPANVNVVIFGGGKIDDTLLSEFLSHSKIKNPNLLIIPQAANVSDVEKTGVQYKKIFENIGVNNIRVLDLSDRDNAMEAIKWSDIMWISGGSQVRLRNAMEKSRVIENIRDKIFDGFLVGGTSAGASIMSKTMMANNTTDKETGKMRPVISYGLGVWDSAIIDQHFSQRKRLPRLDHAVKVHPDLVGIGIDESTGVVYKGKNEFSVIGEGTVTVLQEESRAKLKETDELKKRVLKKGDRYSY